MILAPLQTDGWLLYIYLLLPVLRDFQSQWDFIFVVK